MWVVFTLTMFWIENGEVEKVGLFGVRNVDGYHRDGIVLDECVLISELFQLKGIDVLAFFDDLIVDWWHGDIVAVPGGF